MRPREERLENKEHSWLFQSDWEDAAGKWVLRIGMTGSQPWRWRLQGGSWTGVNLGWKLEDMDSGRDCG